MRRRKFLTLLGSAAVSCPLAARAQQTYRLGCLLPFPRDAPVNVAFFNELRRRGFIEGQNLAVEYRAFGIRFDLISQYTAELVKAQPDVIYAGGAAAVRAVQQATKTISIVGISGDMVGEGLMESLGRPNGNTTGISILATELDGKRQEILIEAVPGLRHMAALADSNRAAVGLEILQEAAHARDVELSIQRVARGEEIVAAIEEAQSSGAKALNVLASPLLYVNRKLIIDRAAALRLPAIFVWAEDAEEGGFLAYGPRIIQIY